MTKFIIYQGIPGSGKTTLAREYVLQDSAHRVRWNQDDIRNMLGEYWVTTREHMLTPMKNAFLQEAMLNKYEVVIDDMNLNPKYVQYYKDFVKYHNVLHPDNPYEIEFRLIQTPLEVCIERDSKRPRPIGKEVITTIYNKYKNLYFNES